jgi:hypothetical protein
MAVGLFRTDDLSRNEVCKNCVGCGSLFWAPYEAFCSLECDLSYSLRIAPGHVEHLVRVSDSLERVMEPPSPPPRPQRSVSSYRPLLTSPLQR